MVMKLINRIGGENDLEKRNKTYVEDVDRGIYDIKMRVRYSYKE